MKVIENELKYIILENDNIKYLISYNSLIAEEKENVLYLTKDWNYSSTTLKHLYYYITYYSNAKDENGEGIGYKIREQKNKKEYIQKLIDQKIIKLKEESEVK